jgi:predicted nucleic acid-binding protein
MIVVDSSVWIDYLNNIDSPSTIILDRLVDKQALIVGDLVMCEVLRGLRTEAQAEIVEQILRRFVIVSMINDELACLAARYYRHLRGKGVTVRGTIDILIATYCIEKDHALLHSDRDFDLMQKHLGLRVYSN